MMRPALVRVAVVALVLIVAPLAGVATAQYRPPPALEVEAGWVGFADDGVVSEGLIGGAVRFYLLPRVSIGPEVVHIAGDNHRHLVLTGNLTWDLVSPGAAGTPRLVPFVVAGAGMFQTRESFSGQSFTSSEGAFTAGGGVRSSIGSRVTVGVDARVGWELHLRVNALLGVRLGS